MKKDDILANEVIELGVASVVTKGGSQMGSNDGDPIQRYNPAGGGIQGHD